MAAESEGAPAPDIRAFANTNIWDTRQLVTMSLLCALGVLLSFIELPLLPGVTWLKYDASSMPAMVCAFAFGPGAGAAVGIAGAIIHGILFADLAGALMNILTVTAFVMPAAALYRRRRTLPIAVGGLALGCATTVAAAVAGNLVITPLWLGAPLESVMLMVVPVLIPFNLAKAVLNSVLTLVVYKSVSNLITPRKKQVKGR